MKKFINHIIIYYALPLIVVILFFNTKASLFLNNSAYDYEIVSIAETKFLNTKTLLLGDSVCRQFFGENMNEALYCYCYNQSYEIPGNYLLLKILLDNKSDFTNVVLIINPLTLASSLDQKYTYNYFVKPFRNHLEDLDSQDLKYINNTFPSDGILKYKFSNYELPNVVDFRLDESISSLNISDRNFRYLLKMDSLCRAKNISFKIVCPPMPSSSKKQIQKFTKNTKKLLNPYFESIIYYDSVFSKDGIHHIDAKLFIEDNKEKLNDLLDF